MNPRSLKCLDNYERRLSPQAVTGVPAQNSPRLLHLSRFERLRHTRLVQAPRRLTNPMFLFRGLIGKPKRIAHVFQRLNA